MIYRKQFGYFCALCLLLITVSSCEKYAGDQTIPAYLSIDSIYITTNFNSEGTASQRITDAWVYVDDDFLGAFELPALLPVLKSGKHQVKIYPGIKKNGIATTRTVYEFYNPVLREVIFAQDSTTRAGVIKTTYGSKALFVWKEDFEDAVNVSLDTTSGSIADLRDTLTGSPPPFEGERSGLVILDEKHDYFECQTRSEYPIPYAPVYLEMNFNSTNAIVVGVFSYGNAILYQTPIITLNPTKGQWKKIYIDLTTTLNAYQGMTHYRVYLRAMKDSGLTQSTILLDNFKILSRQSK